MPQTLFPPRTAALVCVVSLVMATACSAPSRPGTPPAPPRAASTEPPKSASPLPSTANDPTLPPAILAIVEADDRSPEDRALDAGRKPGALLAFLGLAPGARVAEIAAGGGYTTELLARAVGPTGVVFSQNNKFIVEKFAQKPWTSRLAKPVNAKVVRVERELDEPLPPEAKDLDMVVNVLFYHDTIWMKTDRDRMNKAVFDALKPGGSYVIVDHSGRPGTGTTETQSLHRIEETVLRDEIVKAGFRLTAEGSFLRNPNDARDWNDAPSASAEKRGTSDRFVLKFTRP